MSLSPLDFIYNDSSKPNYLESSSVLHEYGSIYDYRTRIANNPISYDTTYSNGFNTINFSTSPSQLIEFFKSFVDTEHPFELPDSDSEIYIPGVRYMTPGIIVFERPPSYQHVSVSMDLRDEINDETELFEWYLPIPWQVYVAAYNPKDMRLVDVKMFFTNSTLYSIDQPVYAPPLFNFYSNGKLCRPFFESMDDFEKYPQNISGIIAASFDWVWNSGFNKDITENISEFIYRKRYTQFEQYITKPNLITSFEKLKNNPLSGIPTSLHSFYVKTFFSAWESVPLESISSFEWSPYSSTDFFYQEINSHNLSSLVQLYINEHDISVHEYDDDHYDEDGDIYCPDNCISEEDLLSSQDFKDFVQEKNSQKDSNKPLGPAIQHFVDYLRQSGVTQKTVNSTSFRKIFHENFHNLYSQ